MNENLAEVENLVAQYRRVTSDIKALEEKKQELRDAIESLVQTLPEQKWKDDKGHAKMKQRGASVSYPGKEVDRLVSVWTESEDAIMQSCGKMLHELRRERSASSYLEVR